MEIQHLNWWFFEFQLKLCKGISYAAVAAHADKSGRRKLAAMLVEHEPRSSKQVTFFLMFPTFSYFFLLLQLKIISSGVNWAVLGMKHGTAPNRA